MYVDSFVIPTGNNGIKISVTSENNIINFNSNTVSSRAITPDTLTYNDNLDFYMWGTNLMDSSKNIDMQQVQILARSAATPTEGTFEFQFSRQFYRLFLVAMPHGVPYSTDAELLRSSISVDLRNCDDIKFTLSSRTVHGKGNVSLSFYADGWNIPSEYGITAGLYDKKDNSPVNEVTIAIFPNLNAPPVDPVYQINKNTIECGTYELRLTFTKTVEGKSRNFYYTDDVVILPNQTTEAVIPIPNVIVETPLAPTYLIAGYVDDVYNTSGFYDVEFCWDDNSYNEEDFELELFDITKIRTGPYNDYVVPLLDSYSAGNLTTSMSDMEEKWNSLISHFSRANVQKYTRAYFDNSNVSTDGSFTSNSVYAVLKLPYGNRYVARIRAVNSAGYSDYAYLDLYNTGNRTFVSTNDPSFTALNWDANASSINRYKIEYNFTNGLFLDDTTETNVTSFVSASEYVTQSRTIAHPILNPVNYNYYGTDTATLNYYYNSVNYPWEKWKKESASGVDFTGLTYDGYADLYLFAYYGDAVQIADVGLVEKDDSNTYVTSDIVFSAHPHVATSNIPFQQDVDISATMVNKTISVSKTTYKYVNLLINKTDNNYSSSKFEYALQGGQGKLIPTFSTNYYGLSYNYGQIDITAQDADGNDIFLTGETYNLFITSVLNGSTVCYMAYLKIEA